MLTLNNFYFFKVYITSDGMLRYAISDTGKGSNISLSESGLFFFD